MKPKRKKIQRDWLENQLAKCERRIQKIAEQAYYIRQAIGLLDQQEEARILSKGGIDDAVHQAGIEGLSGGGESDTNAGQLNIPDPAITQEILDQQSAELSNNS